MPIKDIRSDLLPKLAFNAIINSDTTTNGAIIDTANFDGGIVFTILTSIFNAGTYTPVLEESDDSGMSGANDVADANLIGTEAGAVLSAASSLGANLVSLGAFGTKRFLRLKIVSASSTTTTVVSTFHGASELIPSPDLSA